MLWRFIERRELRKRKNDNKEEVKQEWGNQKMVVGRRQ